ncbi:hypothetical protein CN140_01655 [Sinorhizobium meliloti]|uniref:hypothetical protein n=1 Tax=Rhizobium meliloti TaxID=382 RepID=UPI000FD73D56|nr:hypothetical protein [Sinorhizobium meliloti]RVL87662.1 hypothetical protein CN140_01655 [Sinorhizobium meliloti]
MSRYSDEFLLDIVNSCDCPDFDPELSGDQLFAARDGWRVEVFYKGGEPDYLNNIISPTGRHVGSWDDNGTESRQRLLSWAGIEK